MSKSRKTQIFKDGEWVNIKFQELRNGNKFKLFEFNDEEVKDRGGNAEFTAISDAYLRNEIWVINYQIEDTQSQFSEEPIKEFKTLKEGFVKKGGLNGPPTTSRPSGAPPASKPIKE